MLLIDGSHGEGGGQIVRSALALSMVTGKPFRVTNIRAGRKKPGLMRQHLTAVHAAQSICKARVEGDTIGSTELTFKPGPVQSGQYHFAVGTAGSTTLVLQTVLPALMLASEPSTLTLEGGTHNPYAPPFDFLDQAFLPLVNRMGPKVSAKLERRGFYPAGGGKFTVTIEPASKLQPLELLERGELLICDAHAIVANLPAEIAERELATISSILQWPYEVLHQVVCSNAAGPGNVVLLTVASANVTEVFTGFGQVNVSASHVATLASQSCRRYLKSDVPVGEYLADQLLLPLAITGRGAFRTFEPSEHTRTHATLIQQFLDVSVTFHQENAGAWRVEVG